MKITQVRLGRISTPLRVPFKTALRTVNSVEDVIVELHTDTGAVGYGEAPPTGVITGDTTGAILGAIRDHIAPALLGRDLDEFEDLTTRFHNGEDVSAELAKRIYANMRYLNFEYPPADGISRVEISSEKTDTGMTFRTKGGFEVSHTWEALGNALITAA